MNFTIDKKTLLPSLLKISGGIASKTPSPTLTGILIDVRRDSITLISSNREISIRETILKENNTIINETGIVLVPGSYFIEIIKKLEDEMINISLFDETTVKISTERADFSLNSLDKDNYPYFDFDEVGESIEFSSKQLKKIIRQTSFAAGTSKDRLNLLGVNFELDGNKLRVVATDSYRLSEYKQETEENYPKKQINIPATSLNEVIKVLDDSSEKVTMVICNGKVIFKHSNTCLITRVIEGNYPNTQNFFEIKKLFSVSFNKQALTNVIERINLFSIDDYKLVKMIFSEKGEIKISSISNEIGLGQEEVFPLELSDKIPFTVSFSSKYMLEALKAIDGSEITINFTGEVKPFIINSSEDKELCELILAARVF